MTGEEAFTCGRKQEAGSRKQEAWKNSFLYQCIQFFKKLFGSEKARYPTKNTAVDAQIADRFSPLLILIQSRPLLY